MDMDILNDLWSVCMYPGYLCLVETYFFSLSFSQKVCFFGRQTNKQIKWQKNVFISNLPVNYCLMPIYLLTAI